MTVNKRELTLKGNVVILQMISMRDKETGKYLPLMDGNVNSMLHRIWNNRESIKTVSMTFPPVALLDKEQFSKFLRFKDEVFVESGVIDEFKIIHLRNFYKKDVGKTRLNVLAKDEVFDASEISDTDNTIVSEFPIEITNAKNLSYNYNWNAVDRTNDILNVSFKSESELAKKYDTYLFSDVQADYWLECKNDTSNTYRSINIYSKEFFNIVANYFTKNLKINPAITELIEEERPFTFFPQRIDDPRYEFEEVARESIEDDMKIVIMNPTKAPVEKDRQGFIVDLTDTENKRATYLNFLKHLRQDDQIVHYESDMHISLLEQISICKCKIVHFIECVDDYLKP